MLSLFDWNTNEVEFAVPATLIAVKSNLAVADRFDSNRELGTGWKARAKDNLLAIQLAQTLKAEGRQATNDERAILNRFIGFGASDLANNMFRGRGGGFNAGWETLAAELEATVEPKELAGLAAATQYAHYTPDGLVESIWSALTRLGFRSGRVLEPGCGTGLFIGFAPASVTESSFTGIERESISASIAAVIYPQAVIHNADFIGLNLPGDYDLAIGNPPFSSRRVKAKTVKKPSGTMGLMLHDYFISRSLELVRPGGLAAFVTSHGTMDKAGNDARSYMASLADLIAAVRLPAGAMRATAGTDVVVDILFLHRRANNTKASATAWTNVRQISAHSGEILHVNEYFINHPEHVLGRHSWVHGMYAPSYSCTAIPGASLDDQLETFVAFLPQDIVAIGEPEIVRTFTPSLNLATLGENLKEGSFGIDERGSLYQVINGLREAVAIKNKAEKAGIPGKHARIIRRFIAVRDALRAVLRAQTAGRMGELQQTALAHAYAAFVAELGPINATRIIETTNADGTHSESIRRPNLAPILADPDAWLVASIENYDPESDTATRGPIFNQQVVRPLPERSIVTLDDALAVTLDEKGRVDIAYIASLMSLDEAAVIEGLGQAIYLEPGPKREWKTADDYLSGTVRAKLVAAQAAAQIDPQFERNVEALLKAQPKDLNPSDVTARLGSPWIPTDDIEQFVQETMDFAVSIWHSPEVATWEVSGWAGNASDWGTNRRNPIKLLHDALNATIPNIYDTIKNADGNDVRVLNVVDTEAAKEKLDKIKRAFENWIWRDEERTNRLMRLYNDLFNDIVPRQFDGSHLRLPGASTVFDFYPHQKRGIWRIISSGNTYLAHSVGAGKTLILAASIKEEKRLGLISKAMMAVPGHCLAQASREFLQLYPTASILVADDTNFTKDKRQQFIAQATTGDWDCIIITHSAFKFIPTPGAFEQEMIDEEVAILDRLLLTTDKSNRTTRKRIEALKEKNRQRLENLKSRKDDMVTIAEMGIDKLVIDEAQSFRKLSFTTSMDSLKGVDPDGSQRAWDLYVKNRYIASLRPGRSLTMASGTPITNTLGEMFTVQRFMDPDGLARRDIHEFDAWASSFGDTRTELELQPSGKYKPVTRFAQFVNVPELIGMFRMFADVLLKDDLRGLLRLPRIAMGARQIITAPASEQFKEYQKRLDARINAIKERSGQPHKGDDILLSVITDGRHAAIDLRLVGYDINEPENKLNALIANVLQIYTNTADKTYITRGKVDTVTGAGQLIFSDLGTMNALATRGFSAYAWIRERLIAGGLPASEIAFIQEYKKASEKQALFNRFNAGLVRILLGSSETLGTGANVQKRLIALHHLDVPWLPSQIEQREGRIERQGNQNDEIAIFAYATLTSMDAPMWGANVRKKTFIDMAMKGDTSIRCVQDAGSDVNHLALAQAIASGNPLLMQKAGLDADIARLRRLRSAHFDEQHHIRYTLFSARSDREEAADRLACLETALARRLPTRGDAFEMTIERVSYDHRQKAGTRLLLVLEDVTDERLQTIASIGGFDVLAQRLSSFSRGRLRLFIDLCGARAEVELPELPTPAGIISRIENRIEGLDNLIAATQSRISFADRDIAGNAGRLGRDFEFEAELATKETELRDIERQLQIEENPSAPAVSANVAEEPNRHENIASVKRVDEEHAA